MLETIVEAWKFLRASVLRRIPTWARLKQWAGFAWVKGSYVWILAVPVAAKLVSKLQDPLELPLGDKTIHIPVALPFSWKLFYMGAVCFVLARLVYNLKCPALVREFDTFAQYQEAGVGGTFLIEKYLRLSRLTFAFDRNSKPNDLRDTELNFIKEFLIRFTTGKHYDESTGQYNKEFARYRGKKNALRPQTVWGPQNQPTTTQFILESPKYESVMGQAREAKQDILPAPDHLRIDEQLISDAFWYARDHSDLSTPVARLLCTLFYGIGFGLFSIVAFQGFMFVVSVMGNPLNG
jgi:hypothetical protein